MILALYRHGESWLHRLPAGIKLVSMALASTLIFLIDDPVALLLCNAVVAAGYLGAGFGSRRLLQQLRPVLIVIVVLFIVNLVLGDWLSGVVVVLRFTAVIALASLVTLVTRSEDIIAVLVQFFGPLARIGVPVERLSLMLSMTLRYIPMLFALFLQLRESRQARGASAGTLALLLPLLIRALRQADELADAIDARAYNPVSGRRRDAE